MKSWKFQPTNRAPFSTYILRTKTKRRLKFWDKKEYGISFKIKKKSWTYYQRQKENEFFKHDDSKQKIQSHKWFISNNLFSALLRKGTGYLFALVGVSWSCSGRSKEVAMSQSNVDTRFWLFIFNRFKKSSWTNHGWKLV